MEQKFLIDTNIIIDTLGFVMPVSVKNKIADMEMIVSAITYIETLGWHKITSKQLQAATELLDASCVLPIDELVMDKAVQIRQKKKTGIGDAIIAATALVHNLTLVTRNVMDFKSIEDIKIFNPWD